MPPSATVLPCAVLLRPEGHCFPCHSFPLWHGRFSLLSSSLTDLIRNAAGWLAQLSTARLSTAPLSAAPLSTAQLGTAQVGTAQVGTAPLSTAQLGTEQLSTARLSTAPLSTAQLSRARPIPLCSWYPGAWGAASPLPGFPATQIAGTLCYYTHCPLCFGIQHSCHTASHMHTHGRRGTAYTSLQDGICRKLTICEPC